MSNEDIESPKIGPPYELAEDEFIDYSSQWARFAGKDEIPTITYQDCLIQNVSFNGNDLGLFEASNCSFFNVSFDKCHIIGTFTNCGFYNCHFRQSTLEGTVFDDCLLKDCDFTDASINDVVLNGTVVQNCTP
jgi:uncharacterized protein YjbI with pentapeptide repeats